MRAFVRFRQALASSAQPARKLAELEKKYFDAIRRVMAAPEPKKRKNRVSRRREGRHLRPPVAALNLEPPEALNVLNGAQRLNGWNYWSVWNQWNRPQAEEAVTSDVKKYFCPVTGSVTVGL